MARQLKTALNATAQELAEANERTVQNLKALAPKLSEIAGFICNAGALVQWGKDELADKLGLVEIDREADPHSPALFAWGSGKDKVEYRANNNSTNRPASDSGIKFLFKLAITGRYVITGEALIFDADGMAASAQHRIAACFLATLSKPELKFYFIIQDGIDPLLVDFIDTGKSRTAKDASLRHTDTFLPEASLRTLAGLPYGPKVRDARKAMAGDISTAMSRLYHRAKGEDVKASTTEYSKSKDHYADMLARFSMMTYENPTVKDEETGDPETIELTTLERATQIVYAYDRETGGAISKYFGRGNLLSALIMASNIDNPSVVQSTATTNAMGRTTEKVIAIQPAELAIDLDLVEEFCATASDKVGPFAPYYNHLESRGSKNPVAPNYKFGAMVQIIKWFLEHRTDTTIPEVVNEAGEVVQAERTITSCPPLPGNMIPAAPRAKIQGGKSVVPPLNYPAFGGYDVGLIDKKATKAQAELERAAMEEEEEEAVEA